MRGEIGYQHVKMPVATVCSMIVSGILLKGGTLASKIVQAKEEAGGTDLGVAA